MSESGALPCNNCGRADVTLILNMVADEWYCSVCCHVLLTTSRGATVTYEPEAKPDLFGFGTDPKAFDERATCDCGAFNPGRDGFHLLDCAWTERAASDWQPGESGSSLTNEVKTFGAAAIQAGLAQQRAMQALTKAASDLTPGLKRRDPEPPKPPRSGQQPTQMQRSSQKQQLPVAPSPPPAKPPQFSLTNPGGRPSVYDRRTRGAPGPTETFRVGSYDPVMNMLKKLEPWVHQDTDALRVELLLAYRMIATLVDKLGGETYLDVEETRRYSGREPMFRELVVNFERTTERDGKTIGLQTHSIAPPPPTDPPFLWRRSDGFS